MHPRIGTAALLATLLAATPSGPAMAWGDLGHRLVAETAVLLVERDLPDTWGRLFAGHRFHLGYYSNLPDVLFRRIDLAGGRLEAPTHFLYLDALAGTASLTPQALETLDTIPRGFPEARRHLEERIGRETFARSGSVPWRTAQLLDLARDQVGSVHAVLGGFQSGTVSQGDARRVYVGLSYFGLMSHYSGDAAVPHHASSAWNSYAEGQGGLHFYFESDCVTAFEPGLAAEVLESALRNRARWLEAWRADREPPAGVVIRLLIDSAEALPRLSEIDRRKVVTKLGTPGREVDALRKAPQQGCRPMRALLIERLAKGAVATAHLWETALPGGVDFGEGANLHFSDFELNPEYVPPDYQKSADLDR
jgi:hypothetical protein